MGEDEVLVNAYGKSIPACCPDSYTQELCSDQNRNIVQGIEAGQDAGCTEKINLLLLPAVCRA